MELMSSDFKLDSAQAQPGLHLVSMTQTSPAQVSVDVNFNVSLMFPAHTQLDSDLFPDLDFSRNTNRDSDMHVIIMFSAWTPGFEC